MVWIGHGEIFILRVRKCEPPLANYHMNFSRAKIIIDARRDNFNVSWKLWLRRKAFILHTVTVQILIRHSLKATLFFTLFFRTSRLDLELQRSYSWCGCVRRKNYRKVHIAGWQNAQRALYVERKILEHVIGGSLVEIRRKQNRSRDP